MSPSSKSKGEAKNQGVFVKHYMFAPGGKKVQKAIFSFKVKVKVKVIDLDVI